MFSSLVWPKSFRELRFECFITPTPHKFIFSRCLLCKIDFFRHFYCLSNKTGLSGESAAPSIHNASKIVYCNISPRRPRRFRSLGTVWVGLRTGPRHLEKKSVSCESLFTAALQFNVSPWHGIEARVDSLMASVFPQTHRNHSASI